MAESMDVGEGGELQWMWQPLVPNPSINQTIPSARCGATASILRNSEILIAFGDSGKVVSGRSYFNDIFIYDTKKTTWSKVEADTQNFTVASRSHHSANCFKDRGVLFFGGNNEKQYLNETLFLGVNTSTEKLEWRQIETEIKPSPRRGHSASLLSTENCVIFGGEAGGKLENDLWMFDTTKLQWLQTPTKGSLNPGGRIFHTAVVDSRDNLIVFGGDMTTKESSIYLFDFRASTWNKLSPPSSAKPIPWRYGHTAHLDSNNTMLVYGGCDKEGSVYSSEFQKISSECMIVKGNCSYSFFPITGTFKPEGRVYHSSIMAGNQLVLFGGWKPSTKQATNSLWHLFAVPTAGPVPKPGQLTPMESEKAIDQIMQQQHAHSLPVTKVKLAKKAIVTESRKQLIAPPKMYRANSLVAYQGKAIFKVTNLNPALIRNDSLSDSPVGETLEDAKTIANTALEYLLYETWRPGDSRDFFLDASAIITLCQTASQIFLNQPTCVTVSAPAKVFGDIHGQFPDLLEFFNAYGSPNHRTGDIQLTNYVFVGDFVDRGCYSLEVITLLLSLKVRYPGEVFLIRGNHEDENINTVFGFLKECEKRFAPEEANAVWTACNETFDALPLAAVIEEKILCIHGGLGPSLSSISQLASIQRPIKVQHRDTSPDATIIYDTLWSDPTESDEIKGFYDNVERGGGCVKFGPEKVWDFCKANSIDLIVRAHQPVLDGYEYFASGNLVTVFSATNYCGEYGNSGAILTIDKKLRVTPKVIRPLKESGTNTPDNNGNTSSIQTWQKTQRPPTPLRQRRK